ncbi:PstS family phosphate ABC transporter substrate-binding protein [Allorhodopirellula solitaria]|uniref:Phosphate-binding protein PstS n=1 Tax=Allorhodopirellula solitaria TaxID=2527987 RepID=A0A5C5X2I1_9BACT|nr:substrate-binding domain-containing protein [Allorhodopirellula solitaria]TWT56363.1 Phosphate-binding protein PstS precursor [Allorhodopirellula solitaria]
MKVLTQFAILFACITPILTQSLTLAEDSGAHLSVQEIRSVLNSIPPYLPEGEVSTEIDIFGSTSMDALAHGWTHGFKKFHPKSTVVISAEGSETVFDRLSRNPSSLGMLSRPVSEAELEKLKQSGLKQPVAIMVAREGLGVFVHESNPIESISPAQFAALFSVADPTQKSEPVTWQAAGVTNDLAESPVEVIARKASSGTQTFLRNYLLPKRTIRTPKAAYASNAEVIEKLESEKNGVAICSLKCGSHSLRLVELRSGHATIPCDDHAVLMGRYPLTRPMTLVLDIGQDSEQAKATREFVRYTLHQAGQSQDILAGFFPFDPPTLLAQLAKLNPATTATEK